MDKFYIVFYIVILYCVVILYSVPVLIFHLISKSFTRYNNFVDQLLIVLHIDIGQLQSYFAIVYHVIYGCCDVNVTISAFCHCC